MDDNKIHWARHYEKDAKKAYFDDTVEWLRRLAWAYRLEYFTGMQVNEQNFRRIGNVFK